MKINFKHSLLILCILALPQALLGLNDSSQHPNKEGEVTVLAHGLGDKLKYYDTFIKDLKSALQVFEEEDIQDKKKYFDFVDRCIGSAETQLQAVAFCKQYPDSKLVKKYLNVIAKYALFSFMQKYLGYDERSLIVIYKSSVRGSEEMLFDVLTQMQETGEISGLTVNSEFNATKSLIKKINSKSYEHLSVWHKMASGFSKAFAGVRLALYEHMI